LPDVYADSRRAPKTPPARLRCSRFHDVKFKRQVPFDRHVVDFYCHAAKLAVELDRRRHEWLAGYDEGPTEVLEGQGVRVVRFSNDEVCGERDSVPERIGEALRSPFA
jgi:very-short-patch-repair endonuclease